MHQEHRPENAKDNNGGKDLQPEAKIWSVSYTAIGIWCFLLGIAGLLLCIPDYVPDRAEATKIFIESAFSLAVVIVVVVHAIMYYKQAKEASAQNKIAGDSLIIAHSARVGVHSIESQLQANKPISIRIENVGKVAAFNIEVFVELASLIPIHIARKTPNVRPSVYLHHKENFGRTQLLSGNFKPRIAIAPEKCFSKEEIDLFTQNSGILGIRVHLEWQDGFQQGIQRADFAFAYDYEYPVDEWIPGDPDSPIFEIAKDDQRRRSEQQNSTDQNSKD